MTKVLQNGTSIDLSMVSVIMPLIGKGEYASYDVYLNGINKPIEVFNSDIDRDSLVLDWNNSK